MIRKIEVLPMIARLASQNPYIQAFRDQAYLFLHKGRSFAQHEEDVYVLEEIFAGNSDGFYVDIGASHPLRISNTYLLYKSGWRGVVVEPIQRLFALHRAWRPRDIQVEGLVGDSDGFAPFYQLYPSVLSSTDLKTVQNRVQQKDGQLIKTVQIPIFKLSTLIRKFVPHGVSIDFLSIDIEGSELSVVSQMLREITLLPRCVCIEANDAIAVRDISLVMEQRYHLRRRIECNLIFYIKDR
jgi:FkbM family methyltransferase